MLRSRNLGPASLLVLPLLAGACGRTGLDDLLDQPPRLPDGGLLQTLPDGSALDAADAKAPPDASDAGPDASDAGRDATMMPPDMGEGGPPVIPLDVCGMTAFEPGAAWPSYQRCPFHSGRTDVVGPSNPAIRWSNASPMGSAYAFPFAYYGGGPTIDADGTIYVTVEDGELAAIAPDGQTKWKKQLSAEGWNGGSPTVAVVRDGTIYVALDHLFALSKDGTVLWTRAFAGVAVGETTLGTSPAVGPDGTVYTSGWHSQTSDTSGFFAVRGRTDVWKDLQLDLFASPATAFDGTVFLGDSSGHLRSYTAAGSENWEFAIGMASTDVRMTASIGPDGTAYIGATDDSSADTFWAVNADGSLRWSVTLPQSNFPISGSPALGADGTVYFVDASQTLSAISPQGTLKWGVGTHNVEPASVGNAPIVGGDGTIYFVVTVVEDTSSIVYAVTPDGHTAWTLPVGGFASGPPAIGNDGTLYVATSAGVFAIAGK